MKPAKSLSILLALIIVFQLNTSFAQPAKSSRNIMVKELASLGIRDRQVLSALKQVPRHMFVDPEFRKAAYINKRLGRGSSQVAAAPYQVAKVAELMGLNANTKILVLGSGSGYQLAVLSRIVDKVRVVEMIRSKGAVVSKRLSKAGYSNVSLSYGNPQDGQKEFAPYDVILIKERNTPVTRHLLQQLNVGGQVIVVGKPSLNNFTVGLKKKDGSLAKKKYKIKELAQDRQLRNRKKTGWKIKYR